MSYGMLSSSNYLHCLFTSITMNVLSLTMLQQWPNNQHRTAEGYDGLHRTCGDAGSLCGGAFYHTPQLPQITHTPHTHTHTHTECGTILIRYVLVYTALCIAIINTKVYYLDSSPPHLPHPHPHPHPLTILSGTRCDQHLQHHGWPPDGNNWQQERVLRHGNGEHPEHIELYTGEGIVIMIVIVIVTKRL